MGLSLAALVQLRHRPWLVTGWLWYLGTLEPVIGFVQVGLQSMADRYTYIPLIGIFLAAVWSVPELARATRLRQLIHVLAAAAFLITLGQLSRQQVRLWRDGGSLFGHAIAVDADSSLAHHNLANILLAQGDDQNAIVHYRTVTRLLPNYTEAYLGLGVAYGMQGNLGQEVFW